MNLCLQVTPATVDRVEYDLTATAPAPECYVNGNVVSDPEPCGERGSAFCPPCACNAGSNCPSDGHLVSQEPPGPDGIDEPAAAVDPCTCVGPAPATVDPVSLVLAQAEANRRQGAGDVREDRLAFGQMAVPKDALPPPSSEPDVDEEGLYSLDKTIVELKTRKPFGQQRNDADVDALLDLEEDALLDVDDAAASVNLPSYAEAGYQTEPLSCAPLMTAKTNSGCTCAKCSNGKCTCGKCAKCSRGA